MLREDNADERLSTSAFNTGLIDTARFERAERRRVSVDACETALANGRPVREGTPSWHVERARIRAVYAGYRERVLEEVERLRGAGLPLGADMDYRALPGLSAEAAERLTRVRPTSTAQAARIPAMTRSTVATSASGR